MRTGFIGIIGKPNVGKSTLMNNILGEKIAITSPKPETTRNRITGIYTDENFQNIGTQMIFIDTPGIHKPKNKLGVTINETSVNTYKGVDIIIYLIDGTKNFKKSDEILANKLKDEKAVKFLVVNKIDKISPEEYMELIDHYKDLNIFSEVFGVSALTGDGVLELLNGIFDKLSDGVQYFPQTMATDRPERFLVSEIIREKLLNYLEEEVPHGVFVEIMSYEEKEKLTKIIANIYCEKKSHKGIIIGKNGRKLKGIGKSAREEIEMLVGTKVFLELWVKVKENWRDSEYAIKSFGIKED